jgi:hypothetical protein
MLTFALPPFVKWAKNGAPEQYQTMRDIDMRKILCWAFACISLMNIAVSLRSVYAISRPYELLTLRNLFIAVLFEAVVANHYRSGLVDHL